MATIAEFSIPTKQFTLHETLEQCPDLEFEVDRVVAQDADHVTPFVWVTGEGVANLTSILEADPSVETVELLAETDDDERFYRLKWADQARIIGYMIIECNATVQRAIAAQDEWTLRVLFPDREGVSTTYSFARENDLKLDLVRIYDIDDADHVRHGLTDRQHETLTEAYERGFYAIPRGIDIQELANEMGISHQALSERLRRGAENLIENTLIVGSKESGDNDRS